MNCPKCEENGEEVEMDKFPLIIGDVEQGILVHKCPNCNNEIEESYSDYEPDGSHSSSKGEKANSRTPSASEDVRSLSHLARRDSRESPRNPESLRKCEDCGLACGREKKKVR